MKEKLKRIARIGIAAAGYVTIVMTMITIAVIASKLILEYAKFVWNLIP